ncbi:hypothetical protein [Micromonospora mirobrigensis]|uniref:Uncharacterized protein n=1 Tax=Micromonospora mirobrigensis TaxID=262898 RepID=A0A1C4U4Z9_9ACTN|nr:hypothetical protein [Micromonospora mirobrigensis]SCE66742.1 hypothetical protein GA0070564_101229 [Micromonospora mirobrigensis]
MTNAGDHFSEPDRAALLADGHRRQRRLDLYVLSALLVLGVAAGATALLAGDGTVDRDELWPVFLVMLVPPLVGVVVALVFGRRITRRLPPQTGADPATMRRAKRALRDGHTDDPRVDALARDMATRILAQGWLLWVGVLLLLTQGSRLALDDDLFVRVTGAVGALAALFLIWVHLHGRRRARTYLAGRRDG